MKLWIKPLLPQLALFSGKEEPEPSWSMSRPPVIDHQEKGWAKMYVEIDVMIWESGIYKIAS